MTTNKTGRITGTEMEEAISRFERDCRSDGVGETVRSFIREPLFIWMDALAQASDESVSHSEGEFHAECGRNMIMRTTVGINRMLSIRDVFLISAIVDERYADRDFLMSFAERPKLSRNAQRLEQLLSDSFRDPLARPDMKRCDQAINMLFDIIDMIPKTYRMGQEGAMASAISALAIDDQCSLAAIVCSAVERRIGPAWTSET